MLALVLALGCASDAALEKNNAEVGTIEEMPDAYEGGWLKDQDCPARLAEESDFGNDRGDTPPDFALMDQYGETVHLHDFCARVVLLVWAAFT